MNPRLVDRYGPPRVAVVALIAALAVTKTDAQTVWEVTPYTTRVWLAVGDQPDLPARWRENLRQELENKLQGVFRAVWDGHVEAAPDAIRYKLLTAFPEVTRADILSADPRVKQWDKLFMVRITGRRQGYQILVREFDCRVLHLGPVHEGESDLLPLVSRKAVQMITQAFSPVLQINRTSDGVAQMRLRGSVLLRGDGVPGTVQPGDVLLPFERRTTDAGTTSDVRTIDWTYIRVEGHLENITSGAVTSGFNQPFRVKKSRRVQQLGLRAQPTSDRSIIRLQSRSEHPEPLVGYELHERVSPGKSEFLGHTDWQGKFVLQANDQAVRTLFVKSGNRTVAKLPIVPGLRSEIVAALVDDTQQIAAEGFLAGVETAMIDLVARRESLSSRISRQIDAGEFDVAEALLEEFRRLPTQAEFQSEIQLQQQSLDLSDARLRRRVDTIFVDTNRILGKYLDGNKVRALEGRLTSARQAKPES